MYVNAISHNVCNIHIYIKNILYSIKATAVSIPAYSKYNPNTETDINIGDKKCAYTFFWKTSKKGSICGMMVYIRR
jgi:hypothetical protein